MNRTSWRLIIDKPQSAATNMAIDEAIALTFSKGESPPTLRFYAWEQPSFSIGSFQMLNEDWISALEKHAVPIIRRITGGRGLLHDKELTYSITASTHDALFSSGIKGTFQSIAHGFLKGLHQLNMDAEVVSHAGRSPSKQKNPLCFDAVSWYEITANRKKLIGSAQRRWKSHFLQHGSLVIEKSLLDLSSDQVPKDAFVSLNQISLSELKASPPSRELLIQILTKGFEEALSIELKPGRLSLSEQKIVDQLIKEKYACREWNLYREEVKKTLLR